jgi:Tfp pilus assembly protein PilV
MLHDKNARRGFTLHETMVAIVILMIAFMLVFNLLHTSLRYGRRVESQIFASIIAEKKMEEIRDWATQKSGTQYNFESNWSYYSGSVQADSGFPEYKVSVSVRDALLLSPCDAVEAASPGSARRLSGSAKKVKVTVSWDSSDPTKGISILSLIREPPRTFATMTVASVSAIPNPLSRDASVQFSAKARDNNGNVINDMILVWYVEPMTGNGTVEQSSDGSTATFCNHIRMADGSWGHSPENPPGNNPKCKVKARAVYCGVEHWAESAEITLEPEAAP